MEVSEELTAKRLAQEKHEATEALSKASLEVKAQEKKIKELIVTISKTKRDAESPSKYDLEVLSFFPSLQ